MWNKVVLCGKFKPMSKTYESVKIEKPIVDKVRKNKEKTGVPVSTFFEQAAEEKLKSHSSLKVKK